MNCKPGDIAEYIGLAYPELRGRRMICARLNTATHGRNGASYEEPNWVVIPPMAWPDTDYEPTVADRVLRPIRPIRPSVLAPKPQREFT